MRSPIQIMLIAAGLLLLVALGAAPVYLVNQTRKDSASVVHTIQVENQIADALLQLRRAEANERGFLLTGRLEFLTDYNAARARVVPEFEKLSELTVDNKVQRDLMQELMPLVRERVDEFERVVALKQDGKTAEGIAIVDASSGRSMTNKVRELADKMKAEEVRLLAIRSQSTDSSQFLAMAMTSLGSLALLAIAATSIFLIQRSMTARDIAQAKLSDTNANLETIVERRTGDLREANEEIQRFAYIVSHDLRSPLVNIMGFTGELDEARGVILRRLAELSGKATDAPAPDAPEPKLDGSDQQLMDEVSEAIGFIKSSIGKMDRLINAILQLTREGRREFRPEPIDMDQLMGNIASTVAHQAAEANAQIRIEPLPAIVSDRLSMEQVFSNLIDNALKYLRPGTAGDILVRGRRKLGYVVYDVIDNGRGIDPRDHQRIFDLFRRAGVQDRPGQGIGLAHVRALVRRLGGAMTVSSELDQGSTFTVMLPAQWTTPSEDRVANE